ncbi:hypothetical protein ACWC9F_01915 [Streptomyces sp. NPDC001110]
MRAHRRRADGPSTVIDGLSSRTLAEITRLELTRNYLAPGGVGEAVRCWKDHVRQPRGALRRDDEYGNPHWICCGDPRAGGAPRPRDAGDVEERRPRTPAGGRGARP